MAIINKVIYTSRRLNESVVDILNLDDDNDVESSMNTSNLIIDKKIITDFLRRFSGIEFNVAIKDGDVVVDVVSKNSDREPELRIDDSMIVGGKLVFPKNVPSNLLQRVVDMNGGKLTISRSTDNK